MQKNPLVPFPAQCDCGAWSRGYKMSTQQQQQQQACHVDINAAFLHLSNQDRKIATSSFTTLKVQDKAVHTVAAPTAFPLADSRHEMRNHQPNRERRGQQSGAGDVRRHASASADLLSGLWCRHEGLRRLRRNKPGRTNWIESERVSRLLMLKYKSNCLFGSARPLYSTSCTSRQPAPGPDCANQTQYARLRRKSDKKSNGFIRTKHGLSYKGRNVPKFISSRSR